jgi:hypothetical protein
MDRVCGVPFVDGSKMEVVKDRWTVIVEGKNDVDADVSCCGCK